jgi:acyl-CoA synthetase (AMP-forming)/AMP-acid ligase II
VTWRLLHDLVPERHYGARDVLCHPVRPRTLPDLVAGAAEDEAVVCGPERLRYGDLRRRAAAAAAALAARGVVKGDRVACLLGNRTEFVVLMLAAAHLGAVLVPLGTRLRSAEIAYMLDDSGAKLVAAETAFAASLPAGAPPVLLVEEGALASAETPPPATPSGEEEPATILYTSGTTGRPKGAVLTPLGIVHSAMNFRLCAGLGRGDRAILSVPATHVTGLVAILWTTLGAGGCVILTPGFKAAEFLPLAAAERMTYTVMVPAQYALCLMQPDFARHDLSAWRVGCYGGAPMPEATIAALAEHLPDLVVMNAYGATETTSPTTIMPPGMGARRPDSVGRVVPGGVVRVVDESGREVAPGEPGELWIAGAMVVPGYWKNEAATAASFEDGFWKSGDIGSVDAEGFVRVFDRKKDMINRAGYKVYPAEVENVLSHHPAVAESAVIGRPDPVLGERVHAFVHPKAPVAAEELRAFCAARLADYKVPETIELMPEPLPRNANGKLQKQVLRERVR